MHLADETYKLVQEPENETQEAQVNLTEATEAPNQSPAEHLTNTAQESKPRCINPTIFKFYATYDPIYVCIYIYVYIYEYIYIYI